MVERRVRCHLCIFIDDLIIVIIEKEVCQRDRYIDHIEGGMERKRVTEIITFGG